MFEKIKDLAKRVGVRLGIIKELQAIEEHKQISIDEDAYARIKKNKEIYSGDVPDWHKLKYTTSNGKTEYRNMKTIGMGKVLSQKMAGLIFNEKAQITIDDKKADEFVQETFKANGFYNNFQRYLEYGYALGGMAIKPYYHDGQIKLAYATADAFYPLGNDSERIDEALFVSEEFQNGKYYTLLEWNEWENDQYIIKNELYESETKGKLGINVSLDTIYKNLQPVTPINGFRRSLFSYFKLNTANNKNMQSPLGISIFENSYDTLFMLDYMYDFWYNEFQLGKRRIAVDQSMIRPFLDVNGTQRMAFDPEETVYTPLNMEGQEVKDLSVEIRANEIIQSINALLDILSMQVGFSSGTFTFDGKSVKTATEVVSENSMTFQTKNSHATLVEEGIKDLIISIVDLGTLYGIYNGQSDFGVTVSFDDSIAQDRDQNLAYYATAYNSGFIPKEISIQRVFDIPEEEAVKWAQMIKDEKSNAFVSDDMSDAFGVGAQNVGE